MDMQVATKLYLIELQKKQIEKAQKVFKYSHNELRTFICDFGFCCSFSKNDIHELLEQIIEEEEIRMLRKEMIPRAQLMPFFDRPFFPQR